MRTFRLIGMALIAVLISVNFAACSSDDDEIKDDDGVITNQKKLVEMKEAYEDGTNTMTFSYDSKGKLISIVEKDYDSSQSDIINITWGENTVKESSDGESITYSLNDGLVRTGLESDGRNYSFAYNSSKQLTIYQYSDEYDSNTRTLTWENGKVTKIAYNKDISEIAYSSQTCKGYFPLMVLMVEDDFNVMLAHPELVGMRNTLLPSQTIYKEGNWEDKEEYTYKLDKDGYVESCTILSKRNGSTDTYTTNYTFKWE
ncbi:MAG: DUF4595 domain-containing protein [Bacteroides intestinalis]|nr:DUF4595 domain-containing protein [Bacteroides intestinalis]